MHKCNKTKVGAVETSITQGKQHPHSIVVATSTPLDAVRNILRSHNVLLFLIGFIVEGIHLFTTRSTDAHSLILKYMLNLELQTYISSSNFWSGSTDKQKHFSKQPGRIHLIASESKCAPSRESHECGAS